MTCSSRLILGYLYLCTWKLWKLWCMLMPIRYEKLRKILRYYRRPDAGNIIEIIAAHFRIIFTNWILGFAWYFVCSKNTIPRIVGAAKLRITVCGEGEFSLLSIRQNKMSGKCRIYFGNLPDFAGMGISWYIPCDQKCPISRSHGTPHKPRIYVRFFVPQIFVQSA